MLPVNRFESSSRGVQQQLMFFIYPSFATFKVATFPCSLNMQAEDEDFLASLHKRSYSTKLESDELDIFGNISSYLHNNKQISYVFAIIFSPIPIILLLDHTLDGNQP